jgi:hypothetical protein
MSLAIKTYVHDMFILNSYATSPRRSSLVVCVGTTKEFYVVNSEFDP